MEGQNSSIPQTEIVTQSKTLGSKFRDALGNGSVAFLVTVLFFFVTWFILPTTYYPTDPSHWEEVASPVNTERISVINILFNGGVAFLPWVMLSPWPVIRFLTLCEELGCLGLIILYPIIFVPIFGLYTSFFASYLRAKKNKASLPSSTKRALTIFALIYIISGFYSVFNRVVSPSFKFNNYLSQLERATGKEAFPKGATIRPLWNENYSFIPDNETHFSIEYINPANPNDSDMNSRIIFYDESVKENEHCPDKTGWTITKLDNKFWGCSKVRYGSSVRGFLDEKNKIMLISNTGDSATTDDITSFVRYYME